MDIVTEILRAIFQAILGSPEAIAVIVAFILSVIPGPFKGIVSSFINWILDRWRTSLEAKQEEKADKVATIAVLSAQDVKAALVADDVPAERAGVLALDEALTTARAYGLFDTDPNAEARIRAKYQELKATDGLKQLPAPGERLN